MDKNIVALLDEKAITASVVFPNSRQPSMQGKQYKYVYAFQETEPLHAGSWVIVPSLFKLNNSPIDIENINEEADILDAQYTMSIARVAEVHNNVMIEPNEDLIYKWIVTRLNLDMYHDLMKRNAQLQQTIAESYKKNVRSSFKQQILGALPPEEAQQIQALFYQKS